MPNHAPTSNPAILTQRTAPHGAAAVRARSWTGLGLVFLLAVVCVVTIMEIVRRGDLTGQELSVGSAVIAERTGWLTGVAQTASFLAGELPVGLGAVVLVLWLGPWRRRWRAALVTVWTMGLSVALTGLLKLVFDRPRPPAGWELGPPEWTSSFPSGHSLNATVLLGILVGLALVRVHHRAGRAALALAWLAGSALVGVSRLYLGYHWSSDVIAGWALGVAVLATGAAVALWLTERDLPRPRQLRRRVGA